MRTSNLGQHDTVFRKLATSSSLQEEITLTLGEESYAEVFRTAQCTLNWHRANKGFDVLMCAPATRDSGFPDRTNA